MRNYPKMIASVDRVEPVPRRIRATLAGQAVLDTTRALYVWESANYPQYYVPFEDLDPNVLVGKGRSAEATRGSAKVYDLKVGDIVQRGAARLFTESKIREIVGHVRFQWDALDSWFEEDEEVFVHPRSPYVRVDSLRSTRSVRVELEGLVLAETCSPVLVFETGLPTRYYLNRSEVNFEHLIPTDTATACPYKGNTSGYWSVRVGEQIHPDLAWTYGYPMRELLPIAGLVAFYNEKVDTFLDDELLERPVTHFFKK